MTGLPGTIVSDRDVKLVYLEDALEIYGTTLMYSFDFHPWTDSQKEVVNHSLGNLLRCLVCEKPDN